MEMTLSSATQVQSSSAPKNFWTRVKLALREANEIRALAASAARYYAF